MTKHECYFYTRRLRTDHFNDFKIEITHSMVTVMIVIPVVLSVASVLVTPFHLNIENRCENQQSDSEGGRIEELLFCVSYILKLVFEAKQILQHQIGADD